MNLVAANFAATKNRERRLARLDGRNYCRLAARGAVVAVAGGAVLHPRRQMPAGDMHRSVRSTSASRRRSFRKPPPRRTIFRFLASASEGDDRGDQAPWSWTLARKWSAGRRSFWHSHHPSGDEMDAYERLTARDRTRWAAIRNLFTWEDYVEQAWRIVERVLKSPPPVYEYEPNTWGPKECDKIVCPSGGWHNPDGAV